MRIVDSVTELIGNTPVVRLNGLTGPDDATVYMKLEYMNPGSSVKDRIALAMIEAAEKELPRNLCPLIKSSYGFAVTDKCPYFSFSDVLLAETTCDGKKKMYELMGKIKPMHIMNLPQTASAEESLPLWEAEMVRFKNYLEHQLSVEITDEKLRDAIRLMNRERDVMKRLHKLKIGRAHV